MGNNAEKNVASEAAIQGAFCSAAIHTGYGQPDLILKSYHVSCESDRPKSYQNPEKNYGGLVLYQYNGKSDWTLNGIHCRTGYVILKDSTKLPNSSLGQIHGGTYKSVFGCGCDRKVVAAGFSHYNGEWKFKSGTFNLNCNKYEMRESEIKQLKKALRNWCDDGTQNTVIDPPLNVYITNK